MIMLELMNMVMSLTIFMLLRKQRFLTRLIITAVVYVALSGVKAAVFSFIAQQAQQY